MRRRLGALLIKSVGVELYPGLGFAHAVLGWVFLDEASEDMADPATRQIPWLRVFVEGAVIVGSILLAFAIDAGWDARGEASEEALVLGAPRSEMDATLERIDAHLERRARFSQALLTFLEVSPAALAELDPDSAASQLRGLMFFAPFTASGGSVRSSDITAVDDVELRTLLGAWQGEAENVAEDTPVLTAGALEIEMLTGVAGGPRVLRPQFEFPEVPAANAVLSQLRQEGKFIDALLVHERKERSNLRKIGVLRTRTVAVLDHLGSERP